MSSTCDALLTRVVAACWLMLRGSISNLHASTSLFELSANIISTRSSSNGANNPVYQRASRPFMNDLKRHVDWTLIPWQRARQGSMWYNPHACEIVCTNAIAYSRRYGRTCGTRKEDKCADITQIYIFQPLAFKIFWVRSTRLAQFFSRNWVAKFLELLHGNKRETFSASLLRFTV